MPQTKTLVLNQDMRYPMLCNTTLTWWMMKADVNSVDGLYDDSSVITIENKPRQLGN